jgi:hypothetical protein
MSLSSPGESNPQRGRRRDGTQSHGNFDLTSWLCSINNIECGKHGRTPENRVSWAARVVRISVVVVIFPRSKWR